MKTVPLDENFFQGAVSFEKDSGWIKPWRLPLDQLDLFPPAGELPFRAEQPAGVRLRFQTNSQAVALEFMPLSEACHMDLVIDTELIQSCQLKTGQERAACENLPSDSKIVEIYLPQNCPIALLGLLVEDGAEVKTAPDDQPRWITYGSSITHCIEAHSPARIWPGIVARRHGLNLTCLGYAGNCHLEPMVARMIRDLPADFISLKIGINIQGQASLSARTFHAAMVGFISIIREKHPTTPLAVISPIFSPERETQPNAVGLALPQMRRDIAQAVEIFKRHGDGNILYFDGLKLFGEDLVEDYMPDLLHPNGDGHEILAGNFSELVMPAISKFLA